MANVIKVWAWEIAAMTSSIGSLAAMVILLATFNNHQVFVFHGITLNAIIALLSTWSKTTLLFVLSSTVGQWKWILYARGPRPLLDAYIIDEASRGPLGSLQMLWRMKGSFFINLGALCTVLAIATDPLSQQLIQYQEVPISVSSFNAAIPRAQRYSRGLGDIRSRMHFGDELTFNLTEAVDSVNDTSRYTYTAADAAFQSAALFGLVQPHDLIVQQLPVTCPTGNCTFESFQSLAVCNRCKDVTDQLVMSRDDRPLGELLFRSVNGAAYGNGTRMSLPVGLYIRNEDMDDSIPLNMVSWGTGNASATMSSQDLDTLIWSATMIRADLNPATNNFTWPDVPVQAHECALYYCVNEYRSSITRGVLNESVVTNTSATRSPASWKVDHIRPDWLKDGPPSTSIEYISKTAEMTRTDLSLGDGYNISQAAVDSISAWFHTFMADVTINPPEAYYLNGFHGGFGKAIQFAPDVMQSLYNSKNISSTFDNIATSLSNAIRAGADDGERHFGSIVRYETRFLVVWPWMTLHAFLAVVGLCDLILSSSTSFREGVQPWKSHFLAVMAWGKQLNDPMTDGMTTGKMERIASLRMADVYRNVAHEDSSSSVAGPMSLKSFASAFDVKATGYTRFDHDEHPTIR